MVNKKKIKKTVLIVGGTGFLGHHVSKKLIKSNYNVISISLRKPKKTKRIKKVKYFFIDIRSKKDLLKINSIKKIDYVINLAGYIDHFSNKKKLKTHFEGVKNLISILKEKNIKLFIQAGSSLEYGKLKSPHKETNNSSPVSSYAKAKFLANLYLKKISKKFKFDYLVLRIYQIYGPEQTIDRLVPQAIKSCLNNGIFHCSDGKQKRDYLFVDDFVVLVERILKSKKIYSGIYNVGSSNPIKIKDLLHMINKTINRGTFIFGRLKMRSEEIQSYYPDTSKLRKYFNWRPKKSLKYGLLKTIKFYEQN